MEARSGCCRGSSVLKQVVEHPGSLDRTNLFEMKTVAMPELLSSEGGISTLRLYVMRLLFLLNFVLLGSDVWPEIFNHAGVWDPVKGVAWSFWAALSITSSLGLRYPLKMLPLLLIQLAYKSIWLVAVALPLRRVGLSSGLTGVFMIGVAFDLIAIPWPYVFAQYVMKPGDRWR
jgi:hypothetical protein